MHSTPFDSRSAEAAFTAADQYSANNQGTSNAAESRSDPFGFLGTGFAGLSINDDRRNPANNSAGKPSTN
jgi:hypothetical protein